MLDKFRENPITWDKASRKVYEPLRASAGDNKGRKLFVQIVNDGVVENLSGASLSLFWETKDKANNGLDAFKTVNAEKGEFEIYYTTGMLSNEGTLNANLVLVDANGRVVSEPFTITVFKGIDDDAIQSSDSFTALTQALIDVSNLEQNFTPILHGITTQLQQTPYKSGSFIGMIPNDSTKAAENFTILLAELNKNEIVFLDNKYFISGNGTVSNVNIIGNGELLLTSHETQITVTNSLVIQDISISVGNGFNRPNPNNFPLFNFVTSAADKIILNNVKTPNYVFIVRYFNDAQTIKTLNFLDVKHCHFENPRIVVHMQAITLIGKITIDENTLHNSESVPFNFNNMVMNDVIITNNTTKNDLSFWQTETSVYMAFAIVVGLGNVYYTNNVTSGLKTRKDNCSVYDAYLSVSEVYWKNNIWEDNIRVSTSPSHFNALFYGKHADDTAEMIRVCTDNIFRITERLYSSLSQQERDMIEIIIYRFQSKVDTFIFDNNFIDTRGLKLKGNFGEQIYRRFLYRGNTIQGHLVQDFVRPLGDGTGNSELDISNNRITSTGASEITFSYKVGTSDEAMKFGLTTFKENYVAFPFRNFFINFATDTLELGGNTIINTGVNPATFFNGSIAHDIKMNADTFNSEKGLNVFGGSIDYSGMLVNITENFVATGGSKTLKLPIPSNGLIKLSENTMQGANTFEFSYKLEIVDGVTMLTYPVSGGEKTTVPFNDRFYPTTNNRLYLHPDLGMALGHVVGLNNFQVFYMIEKT